MKPYDEALRRGVQIIGHRGSPTTHPENTIPGFLHAMACGADGVELDVAVTLDDALVVTHDLVLHDGRRVREHVAADLPLPSLDDVLALPSPDTFWFDVEAKTAPGLSPEAPRYARLLSDSIRRCPAPNRIIVRSFDHDILRALHDVARQIPLAALIADASDEWVAIARSAKASIISPHYSTVTAERVAHAHQAGMRVSVWSVNDPRDWAQLSALGVDAIITDNVDQAWPAE